MKRNRGGETWILDVEAGSKTMEQICVRSSGGSESKDGDILSGYYLDMADAWSEWCTRELSCRLSLNSDSSK